MVAHDTTLPASRSEPTPGAAASETRGSVPASDSGDAPSRIDRYLIIERLGEGGMGAVYAAYDPELDRKVAIKLLKPGRATAGSRARMVREARAMAKLAHPNVVPVHDAGTYEGQVFIAMQFVQGGSLKQWLESARAWPDVLSVFIQAGRGLAAAHHGGVLHRDFKPDNVMVTENAGAQVTDFGLARAVHEKPADSGAVTHEPDRDRELAPSLTQAGTVLGTPAYMAPEQLEGQVVDARADQFSFCVALFEGLYGKRPFQGATLPLLAFATLKGKVEPIPPSAKVPAWLRSAVLRGLAVEPEQRWPTMDALLAALDRTPKSAWRNRAIVAGLIGTTAVGATVWTGSRTELCTGASERLAGVWDGARRNEVEAALLSTALPYAEDAWVGVRERLDDYSSQWVASHTDACEATQVRGEQSSELMDLRMACLANRRVELLTLVNVFAQADQKVVARAVEAAEALSGLARCSDSERLLAQVPLPDDPDAARRVAEVDGVLAEARSLEHAGKYEDALRVAGEAREQSIALAYEPLVARALLRVGRVQSRRLTLDESHETLGEAYWKALSTSQDEVAVVAAIWLVFVVGEKQQYEDALMWGRHAQAELDRLPPNPKRQGSLLSNTATVLSQKGDPAAALERFEQALDLISQLDPPKEALTAIVAGNAAVTLVTLGRYEEAKALQERGLSLRRSSLGGDHPDLALSHEGLGNIAKMTGDYDAATSHHMKSLLIRERAHGSNHALVAFSLSNLGTVAYEQSEYDDAEPYFRRAIVVFERAVGADHPYVTFPLGNLAGVFDSRGEYQRAYGVRKRVLEIREAAQGPDHPELGSTHLSLGRSLFRLGRPEEALAASRRSLEVWEQLGSDHPYVAFPLTQIGTILLDLGRPAESIEPLERAWAIRRERAENELHEGLTAFALARALAAVKRDPNRAVELAQTALTAYEPPGQTDEAEAQKVREWIERHPLE